MDIRGEIRVIMSSKGMNMTALSKASGVSYSSIQRYLSDTGDLTSDNFILLLNAIGLDIGDLFNESSSASKFKSAPKYLRNSLLKIIGG
jgi:transcriptional regulator with XRE-family HTH domain